MPPARTITITKAICSRPNTKIRTATRPALKRPAARLSGPTSTAVLSNFSPADFAIATAWRSIARANCSPPIPTWNGTRACPGIGRRAVLHVTPGGEFGSRSGWSVWPDYYFDSLPTMADTGRGSPTGMVVYDHVMFPRRYHDAIVCGRLVARPHPGYLSRSARTAHIKPRSKPLPPASRSTSPGLDVGPDGGLYFCTGGRGTEGGVYRIVWRGQVPAQA